MNNEIGRKITSLTLMAIMVAGGMTFAVPGMMPSAHAANANLFVSAENSQFDNYMSGPQVIEVVVIDSDINETNEAKGEPDVTVNGKILRMIQAVDGNWYGYFADLNQAQIADATTTVDGSGLDFGKICFQEKLADVSFSDAAGIAVNNTDCTPRASGDGPNNVVREAKDINPGIGSIKSGQIGIDEKYYPVIQLYKLNPTGNVVIQYNKGGGAQSTTLTFDTADEHAGMDLDRDIYPRDSQVHATITDLWLNIDPTDEDSWTFGTDADSLGTFYQVFDENGKLQEVGPPINIAESLDSLMCEDNCVLVIDTNVQGVANEVLENQSNGDAPIHQLSGMGGAYDALFGSFPVTITEQGPSSGVFGTYDESDVSALKITNNAARGTSASIDYNDSAVTVLVGFDFATIDIQLIDDEWNSGEEIPLVIVDGDQNRNSRVDEAMSLSDPDAVIPALRTGNPFTLGSGGADVLQVMYASSFTSGSDVVASLDSSSTAGILAMEVEPFSDRALQKLDDNGNQIQHPQGGTAHSFDIHSVLIDYEATVEDLRMSINHGDDFHGYNFFNYDVRSITMPTDVDVYLVHSVNSIISGTDSEDKVSETGVVTTDSNTYTASLLDGTNLIQLVNDGDLSGYVPLDDTTMKAIFAEALPSDNNIGLLFVFDDKIMSDPQRDPIVADFFSFGFTDDGVQSSERIANQIIRIEAEETGDNTDTFAGSLEYVMVNQINIQEEGTFGGIATIDDGPSFVVIEDLTDEDAPRVSYNDLGADGVVTPVSDQQEAPSHSGVVSLNQESYKVADTVVITLEDPDLNVDSGLLEIYTVVRNIGNVDNDQVGMDVPDKPDDSPGIDLEKLSFGSLGRLLDVTFDDVKWEDTGNTCDPAYDDGLGATGFTLVETGPATGIFMGDFQIPLDWCRPGAVEPETTTGLDIEVNYLDFRDASGEIIEVGDSAGVRANTGSISLDRTVYPVPFGVPNDFATNNSESPEGRSVFPIHQAGVDGNRILESGEFLVNGDLNVHIRVNDPDFDINPAGEDSIAEDGVGPVKISVLRGASTVVLGYAGGATASDGLIDVGDNNNNVSTEIRQFGPISEIAPDAGIYELDLTIRFTDGPADSQCPSGVDYGGNGHASNRFDVETTYSGEDFCILQGDILQVEYTDPTDASGDVNTVTDSATFDLRNGVLDTDKDVYIIGSDMILTLIEPDFDLDNDAAETYDLDLIEWDSDAATASMGDAGNNAAAFDPEPTDFRETGDSTGIFQVVIEIPEALGGDTLERGEEIVLEYTDWGPSGSDYVGDEDEDVNVTVFTSNFGATVELDQKVYTWTDKVYITVVAPDHNFDSDLIDEIGNSDQDPLKVSTRGADLDNYKLVETGTDTGIFTGEVILTGFTHNADGDTTTGDTNGADVVSIDPTGAGPTDGKLPADDDDGLTVSFEFSEDETVVGSALIRWNIGEVQWLEASYPASGTGVVRVIDPDMNLDPEAVDNFDVDAWSDSDAGGIDLTVTETNEATGIFEGTVFFTVSDESSGHRLRVAEGDTVTAEYEDNTLPDPYTTADELDITATSLIGTVVPPLERAPAANLRTVDAFGNSLDSVSVDQQVQISADLANGQDREQAFAYLVQIQDANGVTVSLAWLTGSLSAGQSFSPALSWIPTVGGQYTATAFVWESVDNPTALSPPVSITVNVS